MAGGYFKEKSIDENNNLDAGLFGNQFVCCFFDCKLFHGLSAPMTIYRGKAKNDGAPDTLYDVLWCLWAITGPIIGGIVMWVISVISRIL